MSFRSSVAVLPVDRCAPILPFAGRCANSEIPPDLQATDAFGSLVLCEATFCRQAGPTADFAILAALFIFPDGRDGELAARPNSTRRRAASDKGGTFGCVSDHRMIEVRSAGDARNPIIGSFPVLVGFFMNWPPIARKAGYLFSAGNRASLDA